MRRLLLVLLSVGGLAAAQEAPSAPIFFRTPDLATAKEIKDLISHKGLGAGTRKARTDARAKLRNIGAWTVPYLTASIAGRKRAKGVRVPMNAVMTLARILDTDCLGPLREVALTNRGMKQIDVRKTACLALGLFGADAGRNVDALKSLLEERGDRDAYHRASVLALGRIDHKDATAALVARTRNGLPSKDRLFAGALLLAASIRSKDTEPERFLEHEEEIIRRVAATCLLIRPLGPRDKVLLLGPLKRNRKDRRVRALLYHALAAIPRTDEIRQALLRCATRTDERDEARVAALNGLSYEWNVRTNFKPLKRALPRGRNDMVAAAMIFALAQSGEPDAVDELIRIMKGGSARSRFYAAGSLMFLALLSNPGKKHPREQEIFEAIADLRGASDARLREFDSMRGELLYVSDPEQRAVRARERFKGIRDPYRLHLWDWTQQDRAWALVNRLIPALFDLDDIADKSDFQNEDKTGESPLQGNKTETGARTPAATPEEQDLLDFLGEQPYYRPEDVGER